ncbi:hypothetical protein Tco_1040701 [Tanacetum coccineum]
MIGWTPRIDGPGWTARLDGRSWMDDTSGWTTLDGRRVWMDGPGWTARQDGRHTALTTRLCACHPDFKGYAPPILRDMFPNGDVIYSC